MLAILLAIASQSCDNPEGPAPLELNASVSSVSEGEPAEGCWPPGPECVQRDLTQTERARLDTVVQWISIETIRCGAVKNKALGHLSSSRIKFWESGSNVDDYDGDAHVAVEITHLTQHAFAGNWHLARVLIHETAHHFGLPHGDIYDMERECLPDPM